MGDWQLSFQVFLWVVCVCTEVTGIHMYIYEEKRRVKRRECTTFCEMEGIRDHFPALKFPIFPSADLTENTHGYYEINSHGCYGECILKPDA